MMLIAILSTLLMVIAGISKSIMDTINFRYSSSIFSKIKETSKLYYWLNTPDITWKNKYKDKNPVNGPAFIGSTTIFVWVTDAWHFFQMIMLSCYHLNISILVALVIKLMFSISNPMFVIITICCFLLVKIITSTTFELFWSKIWKL